MSSTRGATKAAWRHDAVFAETSLISRAIQLRQRLSSVHSDHKRIARNALWISLFVLLGKSAGAFKEMAIAYRYGIGEVVDAYQLTFSLVMWVPTILINVLSLVLIPSFVKLREAPVVEYRRFVAEVHGLAVFAGAVLSCVVWFGWPYVLDGFTSNLSAQTRDLSGRMLTGIIPTGVLALLVCITGARLQARERHVNTLLESMPALFLFICLLTTSGASVVPLVWGTTLGIVVQTVLLLLLAHRADGARISIRLSFKAKEWSMVSQAIGVYVIGQSLFSLVTPIDQYIAAHLGSGAISALGYANRVLALLMAMGALAIGRATLPVLSEILGRGQDAHAIAVARKWSVFVFLLALTGCFIGWIAAPWAIKLLYQRGAFSPLDTLKVASLFRWGLLQLPFYCGAAVLVPLFASQGRYNEMTIICVLNLLIKGLGNILLTHSFGIQGILISTSLMYAGSFGFYYTLAGKAHRRI